MPTTGVPVKGRVTAWCTRPHLLCQGVPFPDYPGVVGCDAAAQRPAALATPLVRRVFLQAGMCI